MPKRSRPNYPIRFPKDVDTELRETAAAHHWPMSSIIVQAVREKLDYIRETGQFAPPEYIKSLRIKAALAARKRREHLAKLQAEETQTRNPRLPLDRIARSADGNLQILSPNAEGTEG